MGNDLNMMMMMIMKIDWDRHMESPRKTCLDYVKEDM